MRVPGKGALFAQAQNPETAVRVAGAGRVGCTEWAVGRAAEARTADGRRYACRPREFG